MWEKSLSNKIARVFEVVGYVLLIPAILLTAISILFIIFSLFIIPLLIAVPSFGIGLILFAGYIKHSRGNLDKNNILPLWSATFLFNFIPLVILIILYDFGYSKTLKDLNFFYIVLILWWIIACCLSLTAVYDEFKFGNGLS